MKARYKGSALGLLWSVLTPLFMAVIYAFFFRLLAGRAANTSSIIVGVFAWQFTANCFQNGMMCVTGNGNLVKKVSFPRAILPLAVTIAALIDYLISLGIQFAVVGAQTHGACFTPRLLLLPLVLAYHAYLCFGVAMLLASANVYWRDTQHLIGVLISALFFLSPAMYDLSFLQALAGDANAWVMQVYLLNPLAGIFTGYRYAFLPGTELPDSPFFLAGLLWPLVFTPLAGLAFRRLQRNFADYV
jgi:ABC-type polysaccharide/polyol phosphate export permease